MATDLATMPPLQEEAFPHPPTNLPYEDGVPMESDWHRMEMNLLIELTSVKHEGREDFFVGGNMFIYFDANQARDRNFRGPDYFFVKDVPLNKETERFSWIIWEEGGRHPDVIFELTSPSTESVDRGEKKDEYESTFRTPEYFIYDPYKEVLQGWRLGEKNRYEEIQPNDKGWLWCEQLGVWIGTWVGRFQTKEYTWVRFYDTNGNLIRRIKSGPMRKSNGPIKRHCGPIKRHNGPTKRHSGPTKQKNSRMTKSSGRMLCRRSWML